MVSKTFDPKNVGSNKSPVKQNFGPKTFISKKKIWDWKFELRKQGLNEICDLKISKSFNIYLALAKTTSKQPQINLKNPAKYLPDTLKKDHRHHPYTL